MGVQMRIRIQPLVNCDRLGLEWRRDCVRIRMKGKTVAHPDAWAQGRVWFVCMCGESACTLPRCGSRYVPMGWNDAVSPPF